MHSDADVRGLPLLAYDFRKMSRADARVVASWRYDPPYDFYNGDDAARIDRVPEGYVSVFDGGALVGFLCFGVEARVPGCERSGCYADEALDVGLGLRPDLTGRGRGLAFVRTCLSSAMECFMPSAVRLTVATFNERAIRVYERAGFVPGACCFSPVRGVDVEFVVMRRPMEPAERESDALSR